VATISGIRRSLFIAIRRRPGSWAVSLSVHTGYLGTGNQLNRTVMRLVSDRLPAAVAASAACICLSHYAFVTGIVRSLMR